MNLEHKKRVISASLGMLGLLAIYFIFGHNGVVFITVAISAGAYYEFLEFSKAAGNRPWISVVVGAALCAWLGLGMPGELLAFYLAALAIMIRGLWRVHHSPQEALAQEFQFSQARVFGLTYLVLFPAFLPKVHALPHGPALLLLLIGIVWLGDIGAYYGGKAFGKHKLSPQISPGKTVEGAAAGSLSSALWAFLFGSFALGHIPSYKWVVIALLTSLVAQAGDLIESLMKRAYAVKDSGGLIPGHGGVFDRFDSLILAGPFLYLLLRLAT